MQIFARALFALFFLARLNFSAGAALPPRFLLSTHSFDLVDNFLAQARFSLDIEIFHLTDKKVIETLKAAATRGVQIRIILDPGQSRNWQSAWKLRDPRIQTRWMLTDTSQGQLMHAKSACEDHQRVLVGSANWTYTGLHVNREAVAIVEDSQAALDFSTAFEKDWAIAQVQWPRRVQRDEEMDSLPDPNLFSEKKPHVHWRKPSFP